ncbi:glycosyltransferase family 2 protein [Flavobacterium faecale]|uniref:glycosyltransferase family 2 protein n=1 Tax=Flavobacterium faecale TaxID=1355330 RepID=UPI003AB00390
MQASILIVSKNRKTELEKTLTILEKIIDFTTQEVLVFLDGCTDGSTLLTAQFHWVDWHASKKSLGASPARNLLYKEAKGAVLIGLDDDAHPLYSDFVERVLILFNENPAVGVIAFEEIKGVFSSDEVALANVASDTRVEYLTKEFIGCGFAIRKEVYQLTNGFPVWMDIYGEESCVSIEVMSKGYAILFSNTIKVNHRVDKEARKRSGKNHFRFERQLKNTTSYYMVYYKNPVFKIMKLYWHNFKKYALTDVVCFKLFFKVIFEVIIDMPQLLKYRKPVAETIIFKMKQLQSITY